MFQYSQKTSSDSVFLVIFTLFLLLFSTQSVNAAVVTNADLSKRSTQKLSASLQDIATGSVAGKYELTLSSTKVSAQVPFDMPAGDYATHLTLKLAGSPHGRVDPSRPLMVTFNMGKAVPIRARGNRFEAVLDLSKNRIRPRGNLLTFSYGDDGADCLDTRSGGWVIDMARSKVTAKLRSNRPNYNIEHIEPRLRHPKSAPRTVSIIAEGPNKTALEALIAQGIGIRMDTIPKFKLNASSADLKIYVGTRSDLGRLITDKTIKAGKGGLIGVQTQSRKPQLVFTGQTQQQTLELVRAFSRVHLPRSRRKTVSLSEMNVQMPFIYETQASISGRTRLNKLGSSYFEAGLSPRPLEFKFKVARAQSSTGEIQLGLSKFKTISDDSRVSVRLNSTELGFTNLDKYKKKVGFTLPAGAMNNGVNTLTITPKLSGLNPSCLPGGAKPALLLSPSSKLSINTQGPQRPELGFFAANGAPFSNNHGSNTAIHLSGTSADRAASLGVLAKIAQSYGQGLEDASYYEGANIAPIKNQHTLVLGPLPRQISNTLTGAPRTLVDAMRGPGVYPKINTSNTIASIASNEATGVFKLAANSSRAQARYVNGLAALYASKTDPSSAIGIITTARPEAYTQVVGRLTQDRVWSNLAGGVARWDSQSVLMIQSADPSFTQGSGKLDHPSVTTQGFKLALSQYSTSASRRLASGFEQLNSLRPSLKNKYKQRARTTQHASNTPHTRSLMPVTFPAAKPAAAKSAVLRGRSTPAMQTASSTSSSHISFQSARPKKTGFDWNYFKSNVASKITGKPLAPTANQHRSVFSTLTTDSRTSKPAKMQAWSRLDALEKAMAIGIFFLTFFGITVFLPGRSQYH